MMGKLGIIVHPYGFQCTRKCKHVLAHRIRTSAISFPPEFIQANAHKQKNKMDVRQSSVLAEVARGSTESSLEPDLRRLQMELRVLRCTG